uniref:Basic blue protein n=1 Tax=Fagus sylvatica TaxID=28930 RepID=A0A2N9FQ55_FAGSY
MAQGRGSAIFATVLLLGLLFQCENVWAATFFVGGAGGWTFNVDSWPKGKTFRAGDVLVFNYDPRAHNVVIVNQQGYDTCQASGGSRQFQTGSDRITLVKGGNYFICTFPGHCANKMKIAVNAL